MFSDNDITHHVHEMISALINGSKAAGDDYFTLGAAFGKFIGFLSSSERHHIKKHDKAIEIQPMISMYHILLILNSNIAITNPPILPEITKSLVLSYGIVSEGKPGNSHS